MKKSPLVLVVLFALLYLSGCQQKESVAPAERTRAAIDLVNSRIAFKTRADYDNLISNKNDFKAPKFAGFNSLLSIRQNVMTRGISSSKPGIESEELASILNKDNVLQIGKWIIRINPADESVLVIDEKDAEALYAGLVAGQQHPSIYRFKFSDEVLDLLEAGYKGTPDLTSGRTNAILCGGGNEAEYSNNEQGPARAVNAYLWYGVYFELQTRIESVNDDADSGLKSYEWWYKTTCRDYREANSAAYDVPWTFTVWTGPLDSPLYVEKYLIYRSTRALRDFYLTASYKYAGYEYTPATIVSW